MVLDIAILNPEKTIITYRLATLGNRISAHVVDLLIFIIAEIAFGIAVANIPFIPQGLNGAIIAIVSILGLFAYFVLFEALWNGQTPGKRSAGIRVRMAEVAISAIRT